MKISDRVMIPQDLHPEINFVGLLIGPRGNTLKMLEKETGAKVGTVLWFSSCKFLEKWSQCCGFVTFYDFGTDPDPRIHASD